jgi:hypothetical protein
MPGSTCRLVVGSSRVPFYKVNPGKGSLLDRAKRDEGLLICGAPFLVGFATGGVTRPSFDLLVDMAK